MAYDEELADRIRELIAGEVDVTEKRMFGGLAFLIGGNMAVAASGQGGILVRADPIQSEKLVATTSATLLEMRGPADVGLAARRRERRREQAGARQVGGARRVVRPLAPGEIARAAMTLARCSRLNE
jgi:TfoX/Sxy family transcriptional regulator of competence genes